MEKIEAKYLAGLKMTGETTEIIVKDGRKVRKGSPWERAANVDDVKSWTDYDDYVVVTLWNGTKHTVKKAGKKPVPEKDEKKDEKK